MPVSTRSQTVNSPKSVRTPAKSDTNNEERGNTGAARSRGKAEYSYTRNPHYNLKEKIKAITRAHNVQNSEGQIHGQQPQLTPLKSTAKVAKSPGRISLAKALLAAGSKPGETRGASVGNARKDDRENTGNEADNSLKPKVLDASDSIREAEAKANLPTGVCNDQSYPTKSRLVLGHRENFSFAMPSAGVGQPLTAPGSISIAGGEGEMKSVPVKIKQSNDLEAGFEGDRGERIMVYVRLRPLSKKEKEAGARSCVRIVNNKELYLTEFALETDYLRLKRLRGRHFAFDAAFPDSAGQEEVYNTSTAELVEGVLQGRNGSVFCYGATGAGKTHTMLGTVNCPGVMVLAIKDLFTKMRQRSHDGEPVVRLSYLEVYNEAVKDLLSPGRPLILREDKQGTVAAGLTHYQAYSAEEVMTLLHQGNQNRTTEPTRMNETSSRSHAILQVVAEYRVKEGYGIVTRAGKLSLIDLAGSERALATDQRTLRSLEGANINRSLLALSSCINALVEGKKHIPYRNSKLTQLLKDSLGGVCQTAMIANISPSNLSFGETQNTLHWADRAKEIRTKACIANEEFQVPESYSDQAKLLLEVQKENQQLRMQLAHLQQKLLAVQSQALASAPSLPCMSPFPPSSFTPSAAVQMSDKRQSLNLQYYTFDAMPRQESSFNGGGETAEDTIQELRRTIQALEEEADRVKTESAMKEQQFTTSLMSLNREHSLQLKHKNDLIRNLCQKAFSVNQADPDIPDPEQRVPGDDLVNTIIPTFERSPSERLPRVISPKTVTGKTSSVSLNVCNPSPRSTQLASAGRRPQCPDVGLKSPSRRFLSSANGKKRTFWDITNVNSPSNAERRSTRSHTTDAPTMLLQPGFYRQEPSVN